MPEPIEFLYKFYESMPGLIKFVMTWFLGHLLVRGWLVKRVSTWLDEKGLWPDGMAKKVWHYLQNSYDAYWSNPRRAAIKEHIRDEHPDSLARCQREMCATLG